MTEIITAIKEIIQDLLKHKGTRAALTITIAGCGIVIPFSLESCSVGPVSIEFQTLADEPNFPDSLVTDTLNTQDGTSVADEQIAK